MKLRGMLLIAILALCMVGCTKKDTTVETTATSLVEKTKSETTLAEGAAITDNTMSGSKTPGEETKAEETPDDYNEDLLLSTMISPDIMSQGIQKDVDMVTKLAYSWGYPLVRMERVIREYTDVSGGVSETSYRAPLNHIGWARELATPAALDMPTANNDTLYLSAVVDLEEPYVFSVPDTDSRYYVVNVFNMWHELEHYIGQRKTGTKEGSFVIVPPGWEEEIPEGTGAILQTSTSKVWLWGRLRVNEGDDMEAIHRLQDQFDLRPLSQVGNELYKPEAAALEPLPDIQGNPLGFLVHLAAALNDNPIPEDEEALFAQMSRIGLTLEGFNDDGLSEMVKAQIKASLKDAVSIPVGGLAASGESVNGWTCIYELDDFGYNYPNRAIISGPYLGGNGMKEAFYPIRYADSNNDTLSGSRTYQMVFKEEPPVEAFWSLTAYDAKTKLLIDNPIDRYKIGSDNNLTKNQDGSFVITLSSKEPENPDNWLPVGDGEFYLILRMYIPDVESIKSHQYEIPNVEPVK